MDMGLHGTSETLRTSCWTCQDMSHVAALFFSFLQHFKLFHFELQESCILQMPGVTNETGYWRSVDSELEAVCVSMQILS